jgi:gamma-glutamyl-gamma-aminobutyrate hydrolase PuuD
MANLTVVKHKIGIVSARVGLNRLNWDWLFINSDVHIVYSVEQLEANNYALLLFPGGPDVPPSLYNEKNTHSYPDIDRTEKEILIYNAAKEKGIPVTGVCYGCQLLNVLNKGSMIQSVNGHAGTDHEVTDGKNKFTVTSTHHQMMVPHDDAVVVAWANVVSTKDPEALFWPATGDFGVQFHPEYTRNQETQMVSWYRSFVKKHTGLEV